MDSEALDAEVDDTPSLPLASTVVPLVPSPLLGPTKLVPAKLVLPLRLSVGAGRLSLMSSE